MRCMDPGDGTASGQPPSAQAPESGQAFKAYFDFLADVENDGFVGEAPIIRRMSDDDVIIERPKQPKVLKDRYLVGQALGDGAYAKVKICRDLETGDDLAVKIIALRPLRKMRDSRRMVEQECEIMRALNHVNVVRLRDDFFDPRKDKRYFFLDLCLGSVHDLQAGGFLITAPVFRRLPEPQARHYLTQLLAGLQHLHENRVVHKDVKPGNLLLTEDEVLKITDFGVSEKLPPDAPDDTITSDQGTPAILPPEVAGGHVASFSGFKVDMYGAGVCLFFMLLGRVPYRDANVMRILQMIDEGSFDLPEDATGPEARALILRLLARDPEQRPDVAAAQEDPWLAQDLQRRPPSREERTSLRWLEPLDFFAPDPAPLEEALRQLRLSEVPEAESEEEREELRRGLESLGIMEEPEPEAVPPPGASEPAPPAPSSAPDERRSSSRRSRKSRRSNLLSSCCIS